MAEFIRVEKIDRVAVIHLERPKMNALNRQMQDEIGQAAHDLGNDPQVKAVVIYGGERTFAAGADIKEMATWSAEFAETESANLQAGFNAVAAMRVPTVAAVTGYALGGGCELALCCDLRIAADDAVLGQPEILLGLIPGAGGTQRLARLIGMSRAKDLVLTGRFVPANEALAMGLVNEVVPSGDVLTRALELAHFLASGPRGAMAVSKDVIEQGWDLSMDEALALESQAFAKRFGQPEARVGMASFIEHGPGKAIFD
jgi:enoyl-CoA hydratase/carnithine racemase